MLNTLIRSTIYPVSRHQSGGSLTAQGLTKLKHGPKVVRVLRPGGLFIVREHDASPELMPMLDLAHSVFNAVMGVTDKDMGA